MVIRDKNGDGDCPLLQALRFSSSWSSAMVTTTAPLSLNTELRAALVHALMGSAQILGLLVWKSQRREDALIEKLMKVEREVVELKCQRAQDAKANEKFLRIFAAHQQNWLSEKKHLKFQIQGLVRKLQVQNTKHDETVTELSKNIEKSVYLLSVKEEALQEECERRKELKEMLRNVKEEVDKVRGRNWRRCSEMQKKRLRKLDGMR